MTTFAQYALNRSGTIVPLILPSELTSGLGLMNPSIYNDGGKIIANIRQVNYTFYHSEAKLFQHPYGPLTYVHPEDDLHLRTWNWYCELDDTLQLIRYTKIDTSMFDTYNPLWDFVGLEDARIFRWGGDLYLCGVRRDTTPHGEGRMELSQLEVSAQHVKEISRKRIPTLNNQESYCEKNWMPVLDQPFHWVKWANPTELVYFDGVSTSLAHLSAASPISIPQRGGSQVIPFADGYLALTHEVDLFESETSRKDAVYRHRFILWDRNWNIVRWSRAFSILGGHVEFSCGLCTWNNQVLLTFGFQDNAAYLLSTDGDTIMSFIYDRA